jgi:2,3-bisphosphoglycerate-independent phosphoglycerate mutase
MPFRISPQTPLCLCVLDGFGYNPTPEGNTIAQTPTPTLDYLWSKYPHTLIKAAEEEVGLDFGQPGNSEVGHLSIGTGRVLLQHLPRINLSINDNSFFQNPALLKAVAHVKANKSKLHLLGMISTTGVHAHLDHLLALIRFAAEQKIESTYLHLITDGRDAGPTDGPLFLEKIYQTITKYNIGTVASLAGREFTMDRNENWDKIQAAYDMMCGFPQHTAQGEAIELVKRYYQQGFDDEKIPPTLMDPKGIIADNDAVIFINFREDRARQITKAIAVPNFTGFQRRKALQNICMVTMTQYEEGLPALVAFPPESTANCLSDVLESQGLSQFHLAETEKTAHVTYFFNGGRETTLPHEQHFTIKSVPPDQFLTHPEMSATQITDKALEVLSQNSHDVLILNYANADMIGHTGNFDATLKAISVLEREINRLANAVLRLGGIFSLTADHGNAEVKLDPKTGQIYKEHTINPVPFIIAGFPWHNSTSPLVKIGSGAEVTGLLADVAPSLLQVCGIPIPKEMSGIPLFEL